MLAVVKITLVFSNYGKHASTIYNSLETTYGSLSFQCFQENLHLKSTNKQNFLTEIVQHFITEKHYNKRQFVDAKLILATNLEVFTFSISQISKDLRFTIAFHLELSAELSVN